MKRPVPPSVPEPLDTPVVTVAVEADDTATIDPVPLPKPARVDDDCRICKLLINEILGFHESPRWPKVFQSSEITLT